LKVAAEAGKQITLEGQERDVTTAGLARMNMILHDFPTANIQTGNTLTSPRFKNGEQLRTYEAQYPTCSLGCCTMRRAIAWCHRMGQGR
jgi:type I restriction-modification system DNA methylase subunit